MTGSTLAPPRALAERARRVIARVRPGSLEARRPLPIRAERDAIERLWADPASRQAVLAGLPARDASIEVGADQGDWGVTVWLRLTLSAPLPRTAAQRSPGRPSGA